MTCWTLAARAVSVVAVTLAVPGSALGATPSTGGVAPPDPARATAVTCLSGETWACRRTQEITVTGTGLDRVNRVVFLGGKGKRDDRAARPTSSAPTELSVPVPKGARTGPLRLVVPGGRATRSKRRLRIIPGRPPQVDIDSPTVDLAPGEPLVAGSRKRAVLRYSAPAPTTVSAVRLSDGAVVRTWPVAAGDGEVRWDGTVERVVVPPGRYALRLAGPQTAGTASTDAVLVHDAIFPIRGKHNFGYGATNDFGGERNHGGQDLFAACGTPLVAVRPSVVQFADFQSRAGNYVVLQDATGQSYAYMHLRDPSLVKKGAKVRAGQRVGYVGETGRATGCHLHFELWTAPGWYTGGVAIDPLPELRRWAAFS